MDHLLTALAPITPVGWGEITSEATRVLKHRLAGRRLVEYQSADDWQFSSVPLGRVTTLQSGDTKISARRVAPVVELRVDFLVSREELDAADRGASDMDTESIIAAATKAASTEDELVFFGNVTAGVPGVASSSRQPVIDLGQGPVEAVAEAVEKLRGESIAGPYALAVGNDLWVELAAGSDRGYPLLSHLKEFFDGPIVWAPSLTGALLLSQRGGDYCIHAGQDWAIGYDSHDEHNVHLYLQSSLTVLCNTPEAAIRINTSESA